jgi:hypothetical protein
MNKRAVFIGLIFGIVLSLLLIYPLKIYLPGQFVEGLPSGNAGVAWVFTALGGLLLIFTGFFAARTGEGQSRLKNILLGAGVALLSTLIAEITLGGATAGVWGAEDILGHGPTATQDEAELYALLSQSVMFVHLGSFASVWMACLLGVVLGSLGGMIAKSQDTLTEKDVQFWIPISGIGVLIVTVTAILVIVVFPMLIPATENALEISGVNLPYPPTMLLFFPLLTNLTFLIFFQVCGWWAIRGYSPTTLRDRRITLLSGFFSGLSPLGLGILYLSTGLMWSFWGFVFLLPFLFSLFILRQTWGQLRKPKPENHAPPLDLRRITKFLVTSGGILLFSNYLGFAVSMLNTMMLIIPLVPYISLYDPAVVEYQKEWMFICISELVDANYAVHFYYLLIGTLIVLIGSAILTGLVGIIQRCFLKISVEGVNVESEMEYPLDGTV